MDGRRVEQALQRGVREALIRHKKLGESVAVWQNGKAVVLPPEEIPDWTVDSASLRRRKDPRRLRGGGSKRGDEPAQRARSSPNPGC